MRHYGGMRSPSTFPTFATPPFLNRLRAMVCRRAVAIRPVSTRLGPVDGAIPPRQRRGRAASKRSKHENEKQRRGVPEPSPCCPSRCRNARQIASDRGKRLKPLVEKRICRRVAQNPSKKPHPVTRSDSRRLCDSQRPAQPSDRAHADRMRRVRIRRRLRTVGPRAEAINTS